MKVRAKKKHINAYGDAPLKFPGKHYELPDDAAAPLIDIGIVEQLPDDAEPEGDGASDEG